MFPTLYDAADSLGGLGYGRLSDAIYCHVREERNGSYELEMQYPVTGLHYDDIVLQGIIVAKPNGYTLPQRFRISEISRPINGVVTIYANHISYDLSGIPVAPFDAISASFAMAGLVTGSITANPFTTWTDISSAAPYSQTIPKSFRACLGGSEGSMLDTYGGELEFDNYDVKLWAQRGTDRGVRITYGKNLTDVQQDENCAEVYSGVYPYYYNSDTGAYVELTEKIVTLIESPDVSRVMMLDLTQEFEDAAPSEVELRTKVTSYINAHDLSTPQVSLTVSFQQLEKTDEYRGKALLEEIRLCDTVTVLFPALGVNASAKCISYDYDCLAERFESIELGSPRSSLADTIVQNAREAEQAPQIALNLAGTAIQHATEAITGNLGGNIVLHDADGDGLPDELLILIDADNINDVTRLWRANASGIGYSSTGYNGTYGTAITADGTIVADFVSTGVLGADVIFVGELQGAYGTFRQLLAGISGAQRVEIGFDEDTSDPFVTLFDSDGNEAVSHRKDGTYYTNSVRLVKATISDKSGLAIYAR